MGRKSRGKTLKIFWPPEVRNFTLLRTKPNSTRSEQTLVYAAASLSSAVLIREEFQPGDDSNNQEIYGSLVTSSIILLPLPTVLHHHAPSSPLNMGSCKDRDWLLVLSYDYFLWWFRLTQAQLNYHMLCVGCNHAMQILLINLVSAFPLMQQVSIYWLLMITWTLVDEGIEANRRFWYLLSHLYLFCVGCKVNIVAKPSIYFCIDAK